MVLIWKTKINFYLHRRKQINPITETVSAESLHQFIKHLMKIAARTLVAGTILPRF